MVLPQGRAEGEMLTSRDGLPYSAFRFLIILIYNIINHDDDDDDDDDDYNQVSPVCIAARGGSTLVKASSCSYSWMGGHKKCKVILSLVGGDKKWLENK